MSIEEIIKDWESILSRDPLDVPWDLIDDTLTLLKKQETMMQCIKGKCRLCPHCANCDVDENGLLKEGEAKTGHWISVYDGDVVALDNDGCPERDCYCSVCKTYFAASDEYVVHGRYCPFCGAKMTGEVNANG